MQKQKLREAGYELQEDKNKAEKQELIALKEKLLNQETIQNESNHSIKK